MNNSINRLIKLFSIASLFISCENKDKLFELIPAEETGVTFSNRIVSNDTLSIINTEYIYNGGGVGIADFNNDGLQDIFFSGNQAENELYLNKGDFKFQNVTKEAKLSNLGRWCSGVTTVDINADGLMDVYVSATMHGNAALRKNLLFVNQGMGKDGIPTFSEMAENYGIADNGHGEHAAFFDYDNDGDLDLYVLIDLIDQNPNLYRSKVVDGTYPNTDKLYRNDYSTALKHPVFTDVSKEAGIRFEGFGLGLNIADINQDGWKDIYITNDYAADDLLYINNQNGTFTNEAPRYFKHTSNSAMGNDIADINNDGLADFVALDMQPKTNQRKKLLSAPNNYFIYQSTEKFGYNHQYMRNTLQLNMGNSRADKKPIFSEISLLAGVAETDWSWCPSLADFDNDGYRDLFITNGFPRDVTDRDFMAFRVGMNNIAGADFLLASIPEVKIANYAFKNNGDLTFEDKTNDWGLAVPSFSNGAAYADLDNDGDLDYVVNNINDSAFVYKNLLREKQPETSNFLRVKFEGEKPNIAGYGAIIKAELPNGEYFFAENSPVRGYLSSVEPFVHIGLGKAKSIKSLTVIWGNGKVQNFKDINANQTLSVKESDAKKVDSKNKKEKESLFSENDFDFTHDEFDFIDFNYQSLLPQKLSQLGPSMAVGDVNGDGLEDIYIAGAKFRKGRFMIQNQDGSFLKKDLLPAVDSTKKQNEEIGTLLFDADNDGDLDLYIVNGGNEGKPVSEVFQDRLFLNDGKANFSLASAALPRNYTAGSCVRADDFDKDGDLDLFIGGRNLPFSYPKAVSSTLLRNDSKNGNAKFTDITQKTISALNEIGLVCDALWSDYDNDGDRDLLIAGEFSEIIVFENQKGSFKKAQNTGLENYFGMWNSINGGDFDADGDIDYILGNVGLNALFKGTKQYPAKILSGDFDQNGTYDAIPFIYLPKSNDDNELTLVPFNAKDDMGKQLPMMQGRYTTFGEYAQATFENILDADKRKTATEHTLNYNASVYVENLGKGKFKLKPLPNYAQFAPINGVTIEDFDNDGNLDVLLVGNNFGNELSVGRYDALNGLLLLGNGKGDFTARLDAGFEVLGDAKALVKLIDTSGKVRIAASQNRGKTKLFTAKTEGKTITTKPTTTRIDYVLNNKRITKEIYYGASYLSQSSRRVIIPNKATHIKMQ